MLSAKKIFTDIGLGEHLWLLNENDEEFSKEGCLLETVLIY